jgi:hypothetical protein
MHGANLFEEQASNELKESSGKVEGGRVRNVRNQCQGFQRVSKKFETFSEFLRTTDREK